MTVFLLCAIGAMCVAGFPEVRLDLGHEVYRIPGLGGLNQRIAQSIAPPAVILFNYSPPASPHNEPVYNFDVADPMSAPIIRAHDLGLEKNRQIISYFAARRPDIVFYRFDRGPELMQRLGTAADLESRGFGERAQAEPGAQAEPRQSTTK